VLEIPLISEHGILSLLSHTYGSRPLPTLLLSKVLFNTPYVVKNTFN
jgi:hypothetical protein